ncbi:hypothetical protein MWU53_00265 [Aliiroseovarius sp. S1123]|jgi:hypothetical protein|uniref:hypothetical protein n=1 Tax=unclassified Aliiroseovarius TaxID=2623558 RepID=UPI001FF3CDB8|nr:hypothetical protein [Aliiroseovarius sp. S1123]MCK0169484.1 hypothetical protein [Aliiroseovarius sp. S1123]
MLKYVALVALVSLAACSRPLSENEVQMSQTLFGDTLDTSKVRVRTGIGLLPLPRPKPIPEDAPKAAPRDIPKTVCDRVPQPDREWEFPPGFALWNQIYLKRALYRDDMFAGWPKSLPMPHALIMAHELVHVWQWQNRDRTGYTPTKSGAESFQPGDPYYWPGREAGAFLSYNFEAQAALVEDYMCMTLFVPDHPRRKEIEALITPVIPVDQLSDALGR